MSTCSVLVITPDHELWFRLGLILPAGFSLIQAPTPERGLEQIEACDMVLIDADQPGFDDAGIQIFCVGAGRNRVIPILVLSDDPDEMLATTWLAAGALDYLARSFQPAVLCARLQAHLRVYRRQPTSPIAIGDCRLYPAQRLLCDGRTTVRLTVTETAIVCFLSAQAAPVSHIELCRAVWGIAFRARPVRLHGHVWRLRRKIAGHFHLKLDDRGYSVAAAKPACVSANP